MAYDLPFLSSAQRRAANLRPRTEEELDPWGATTVPRAPRVLGPDVPTPQPNVVFDAWLRQHQAETQPIIPAQAPVIPADMMMADRISEFERTDSPYGDERRTFSSQAPADSFLATPEPSTPLGRMEAAERFGVPSGAPSYQKAGDLSPEVERGLIAAGLMEPAAPTVKVNEYEWLPDKNRWAAPPMDEITDPGYEEFVSGQWVPYTVMDREGNTSQKMVPVKLAQELARRTGLQDQPDRPVADVFGAVEFVSRPLEVWAQTVAELFKQIPTVMRGDFGGLEGPTLLTEGFMAAHEKFRDRPLWQQIVLGILTDPVVMLKGLSIGAKLTGAAYKADLIPLIGLFRREIAHAASNGGHSLGDDAMDEMAEALTDAVLRVRTPAEVLETEVRTSRGW